MSVIDEREYWDVVHELDEAQREVRKLREADQDRKRYARRYRYLKARNKFLAGEFRAIKKERDNLKTALAAYERRVFCDDTKVQQK